MKSLFAGLLLVSLFITGCSSDHHRHDHGRHDHRHGGYYHPVPYHDVRYERVHAPPAEFPVEDRR